MIGMCVSFGMGLFFQAFIWLTDAVPMQLISPGLTFYILMPAVLVKSAPAGRTPTEPI